MTTYSIRKPALIAFLILGIALIVTNFLLVRNLSKLERSNKMLALQTRLQVGSVVPPFVGYADSGAKIIYGYGSDRRDTLLLVLAPACHACEDNWPNWNRLIKALDNDRTRLVIANIDPTQTITADYAARHGISDLKWMSEVTPESQISYRLASTPQTILIGPDGRVLLVRTGFLTDVASVLAAASEPSTSAARVTDSTQRPR